MIHSVSYFNLGAWSFVWGIKPTKVPPWRPDWLAGYKRDTQA